jgi:hypothetical protein
MVHLRSPVAYLRRLAPRKHLVAGKTRTLCLSSLIPVAKQQDEAEKSLSITVAVPHAREDSRKNCVACVAIQTDTSSETCAASVAIQTDTSMEETLIGQLRPAIYALCKAPEINIYTRDDVKQIFSAIVSPVAHLDRELDGALSRLEAASENMDAHGFDMLRTLSACLDGLERASSTIASTSSRSRSSSSSSASMFTLVSVFLDCFVNGPAHITPVVEGIAEKVRIIDNFVVKGQGIAEKVIKH